MTNEQYPSGAALLLGTILKRRGHEVKVLNSIGDRLDLKDIIKIVEEFKPQVIGITVSTYQIKQTLHISIRVKRLFPSTLIVIGGAHVSAIGGSILEKFFDVDIAVLGEGEEALVKIVEEEPLKSINNIVYRNKGEIIETKRSSSPIELDTLPFPDLSLVNLNRFSGPYPVKKTPSMFIMASRGCPFNCTFCCKPIYGNTVRFHSPEYVIELVEYLNKKHNIKEVYFQDDTFNLNRRWAVTIVEGLLKKNLNKKMTFRASSRVNENLVDLEWLNLLKKSNFWLLYYGVESGDPEMLIRIQKGITVEEVKRAFSLTRQAGIKTESSFILGLPGETIDTIKASINLWKEIKPFAGGFSRAVPFPGTQMEIEVRSKGYIKYSKYEDYTMKETMVRTEALTYEELENWARYCERLMYWEALERSLLDPGLLLRSIRSLGKTGVYSKIRSLLGKKEVV